MWEAGCWDGGRLDVCYLPGMRRWKRRVENIRNCTVTYACKNQIEFFIITSFLPMLPLMYIYMAGRKKDAIGTLF